MKRIIDCRLESSQWDEEGKLRNIKAQLTIVDREKEESEKITVTYEDACSMLDCEGKYKLESGDVINAEELCNPGGIKDLAWVISLLLNLAYYGRAISTEKYIEKVCRHFDVYYLKNYFSSYKLCDDFYRRYFIDYSKYKYGTYQKMLEHYEHAINEKARYTWRSKGGKFAGCYHDYYDRLRPLTTRKTYEKVIPYAEKLRQCFIEETRENAKLMKTNVHNVVN